MKSRRIASWRSRLAAIWLNDRRAGELLRAVARDARGVVTRRRCAAPRPDIGDRPGEHPGHDDGQDDARDGREQDRGEDDVVTDSSYMAWA